MPLTRIFIQNQNKVTRYRSHRAAGAFLFLRSIQTDSSFRGIKTGTTAIDDGGKSTHEKTGREGRVVSAGSEAPQSGQSALRVPLVRNVPWLSPS